MTEQLAIIGLDALDYDELHNAEGFNNLKQDVYGKVDNTPSLMQGKAVSPTQWTSFMTGKPPSEHGVYGFDWDFPFSDWMYRLPTPNIGLENILSKVLMKSGRAKDFPGADAIQGTTFVDELGDDLLAVNVPLYEFSFAAKGNRLEKMGRHKPNLTNRELLENLRVHSEIVLEDVKDALAQRQEDWSVFFSYFYWLDGVQHQFFNQREVVETEYMRADHYVRKMKEWLPDNCTVIVVSDHGADGQGGHRDGYGFWSCNKPGVVPADVSILDFYSIVMRHAGLPTRRDERQTRNRLKALGYI